jgi:hypothetical protein
MVNEPNKAKDQDEGDCQEEQKGGDQRGNGINWASRPLTVYSLTCSCITR